MKVPISPGVGIIKIFKALDYEAWFALAEYVDNSISSFYEVKKEIELVEGNYKLKIEIDFNFIDNTITVTDNAGGIKLDKFGYAFRAAEIPDDTSGLNEFGMGMKTASSWLANKWSVRTKAFGEKVERTIQFDVNEVVKNDTQELEAVERELDANEHYTVIHLSELTHNAPHQRDLRKIKKHLSSIHRKFLRTGYVEIFVEGEKLEFLEQNILIAPKWDQENGEKIEWKIEIDRTFGSNKRVFGFVALLETMSTSVHNGFSLFRRGRVIEGSGDDLYRPKQLSGQVGSHQFKRVFGELELEGFNVDFTKGKFQGDADFDELFNLLQDYCDSDSFPLLRQARNYRKPQPKETLKEIAKKAVLDYNESLDPTEVKKSIEEAISKPEDQIDDNVFSEISEGANLSTINVEFEMNDEKWIVELNLVDSPKITDWIELMEESDIAVGVKKIKVRLSLIHPFMSSFGTTEIQPFIRLAMALAISESIAREADSGPGGVRRNLNKILLSHLSR